MYTLTLSLFFAFTLFIGICGFTSWDASFLQAGNLPLIQILLIAIGIILLFFSLFFVWKWIQNQQDSFLKKFLFLPFLIILVGQLFILFYIQPVLRYDALKCFDQAMEMLSTHQISNVYENGYFARYTNNYPITLLTYFLLSFAKAIHIPETNYLLFLQLINVFCIQLALYFGFKITMKLRGLHMGCFYLVLALICPLSYVWAGYYYTNTLSMPFLMGSLYLYLKMKASHNIKVLITQGFLLGILLVVGYKLRATTLIVGIAIVLDLLLSSSKEKIKAFAKPILMTIVSCILAMFLTLLAFSQLVNTYVSFDYENSGFPMVHWVMMGSRWDGAYDMSDEEYSMSFDTKEEKVEAATTVLIERIEDAGPLGLISLCGRKLLTTWVDGSDGYFAENSYATPSKSFDYLFGDKSGIFLIYAQAFRVLQMLLFAFISAISLYRLWKKKEKPATTFLLTLTFLGTIAFYVLWESNTLYSISLTFLGFILMADVFKDIKLPRFSFYLCAVTSIVTLLLCVLGYQQLVNTPIEDRAYEIHQYQYSEKPEGVSYVDGYDEAYVQSFTVEKPFNRIALQATNNVGSYNQSAFMLFITDEDGNMVYENIKFLPGMVVKTELHEIDLNKMIVPDGPTTYTLTITPGYIQDENSLELYYYATGNYDLLPGGELSIAGEEKINGDLAFAVYEYSVTTYYNWKEYLLLCMGLLGLVVGVTFVAYKKMRQGS